MSAENFKQIVTADFEFETSGGEFGLVAGDLPAPLCMVAYVLDENLRHVRTMRVWRGEFGPHPPFDVGPDTLFVAYSAWAELTCFLQLGWTFPRHVFDQHTAYLAASNVLLPYNPDEKREKPRKRLSDAAHAYDIEGWERIDKEEIARAIGEGRWREYGRERVLEYCEEDVARSADLLRAQLRPRREPGGRVLLPAADPERIIWWSEYSAKVVARVQARGMPIDVELWNLVQENKAAVVVELLRQFDPSAGDDEPIFDPAGGFSYARFERWLARSGASAWPRLDSGKLDLDSDAFRLMYHVPGVEGIHALRDSLRVIVGAKLPIGRDGRNRPSLFPFGTATGRNAHRKSLYNCHAGLRSFMRFPPDKIAAYLDWRTQEVGIAAVLSGDDALRADYAAGDVYHALAKLCGLATDPDVTRWKRENADVRHRMKGLQLGVNYGMGVPSLARGIDRHPLIASTIIERHRRRYPRFWEWRENAVMQAMLERRIESTFGWPLRISTSPNPRTLYNFPMQSAGADMLRLAATRLCAAGLVPSMLVHDGILFELDDREQVEHAREIMRQAGRDTCAGFEIGVDVDQMLSGGACYADKRPAAQKMWATIMRALRAVGALPASEFAAPEREAV
jgi:DNA polymerase-1